MAGSMDALAASLVPADAGSGPPLPTGAAGTLPAPMGSDPSAMGGMPPGPDPSQGMTPAGGNPYPTTDPNFMSQVFSQLVEMQQQDVQHLQDDQHSAMAGDPIFQSLVQGAPLGPGAGQDGQGIGVDPNAMPMPGA